MSDWGPWMEHSGDGFPVPLGTFVCRYFDSPFDILRGELIAPTQEFCGELQQDELVSWNWSLEVQSTTVVRVIRYRLRRPKALQSLIRMVETMQEEVNT